MAQRITKIEVDKELCIGAATCIAVAPEVYELDEDNIAIVLDGWKDVSDETLIESAESCPTNAIFLYDNEGNQIYP